LGHWPDIDFQDNRDACLFITTIYRKKEQQNLSSEKSSEKTDLLILENLRQNSQLTIKNLSEILHLSTRAIEKQMATLKEAGKLKRYGSRKQGHWEIIE